VTLQRQRGSLSVELVVKSAERIVPAALVGGSFLRRSPTMMLWGPLIGRECELLALEETLSCGGLVTVTGVGGCGKTKLALELAARAGAGPEPWDGVVVELAAARTSEQVVDGLLRGLGGRERGGRTPIEIAAESLAGRRALLVLDNCEQVAGEVASAVGALLDAVPGARVLVTSRSPLGLAGERVFVLGPMGVPDAAGDVAAVVRSDGGRLFVDRAATVDPGFELTASAARAVVRICHELDGLPLALCLAAARVGSVSLGEIADGLSRRGRLWGEGAGSELARHRSLRASLDWSWHLLDERERLLLRGLSAFAGGWTAAAARSVVLPQGSESEVRGLLEALEAKGLIVATPVEQRERWSFLQTVGEYAAEQLAKEGEGGEVGDRHIAWFRSYAAQADGLLSGPGGHAVFEQEAPNLRLAFERALERDQGSAFAIAGSLMRHWILADHFEEGARASAAALSLAAEAGDPAARALVHCGAGLINTLREDYAAALASTHAGVALLAALTDRDVQARCLQMSGMVLILTGLDLPEGLRMAERAVELLRASGDRLGVAWALVNVAMAASITDRFDAARAAYEEFLTIPGASEQPRLRTWAELAAAWTELIVGSPERALRHADLALALEGDRPSMTRFVLICNRVHALALLGRPHGAVEEGLQALTAARQAGAPMAAPAIEMALAVAQLMDGELESAEARAGPLLDMPQTHTVALMREVLAQAALARGDGRAAQLHGRELGTLAQRTGSPRHRALADYLLGSAAIIDGEPDRGRELIQSSLAGYAELGLERGAADALEELGLLAAAAGDGVRAARLAAAASAARSGLGCAPLPRNAARVAAAHAQFIDRDGEAGWGAAWAEGAGLLLADAIAYARRARGPRGRPSAGWASLTPAELEVTQLVADGLSNPAIASRLFISRSTVKMHLSNVYLKLGIANRTQLAREMAMHADHAATAGPHGLTTGR
jgi:predicted ATPase/DNA-binding CsgD family transcriptional regulator